MNGLSGADSDRLHATLGVGVRVDTPDILSMNHFLPQQRARLLFTFCGILFVSFWLGWNASTSLTSRLQLSRTEESWQQELSPLGAEFEVPLRLQAEAAPGLTAPSDIRVAICTSIKLAEPEDLVEWVLYYKCAL